MKKRLLKKLGRRTLLVPVWVFKSINEPMEQKLHFERMSGKEMARRKREGIKSPNAWDIGQTLKILQALEDGIHVDN